MGSCIRVYCVYTLDGRFVFYVAVVLHLLWTVDTFVFGFLVLQSLCCRKAQHCPSVYGVANSEWTWNLVFWVVMALGSVLFSSVIILDHLWGKAFGRAAGSFGPREAVCVFGS